MRAAHRTSSTGRAGADFVSGGRTAFGAKTLRWAVSSWDLEEVEIGSLAER